MESESNDLFFYEPLEGYQSKKEDAYLNNFEITPFTSASGQLFLSVEHYYQAHKFGDASKEELKAAFLEIQTAPNADICKKAARRIAKEINHEVWNKQKWDDELKDYYMKRGLTYKFSQHKELLLKLISTGDKILKEESKKDKYWGGLLEGSLNKLGNMLIEIRENYKKTGTVFIEGSNLEAIKVEVSS